MQSPTFHTITGSVSLRLTSWETHTCNRSRNSICGGTVGFSPLRKPPKHLTLITKTVVKWMDDAIKCLEDDLIKVFNGLAVSTAVHQLEEAMSASYGVPQSAGLSHPSHSPSGEQLEDIAISETSQPLAILEEEMGSQNGRARARRRPSILSPKQVVCKTRKL